MCTYSGKPLPDPLPQIFPTPGRPLIVDCIMYID
uniref:Uncharacterized protein n=1 Tax=Myoviridae sp. ctfJc17 TaxID=2827612 RepID=A0A8S5LRD8_9CAUD|nr:MAG TPA: hypothetical protein [Myoviridae sp. ctfJc17]